MQRDRACAFVPTPSGDSDRAITAFFEALHAAETAEPSCLRLFGIPEQPVEQNVEGHDVIYVSGGNTANALAVWRLHSVDVALRAAWEQGAVCSAA